MQLHAGYLFVSRVVWDFRCVVFVLNYILTLSFVKQPFCAVFFFTKHIILSVNIVSKVFLKLQWAKMFVHFIAFCKWILRTFSFNLHPLLVLCVFKKLCLGSKFLWSCPHKVEPDITPLRTNSAAVRLLITLMVGF